LDNHAYDRIDIDASRRIKEKLDRILLLLKPPVVVDLTKFIPETVAKMLQRIETNSTDDGMEGEESLKHFFSKKVKTGNHFQFYRSRGMNMLRNCGFRCPMNAAMFCTAAALPTNFFAKLTLTDLSEMDTLSYFLIRELICLRLSNVSNVGADFLVDNTWLPSTPLALQLWEIAASAREVMDDGEHDLFRDVSEMMEILFKSPRDMMPPLVKGIFQPFVMLICNEGVGPNSPHKLQDLVRNDPENTGSILTDAPLVSFEIGTELSANHAVFSTVFRADCYIRALGKKEWVLESAKTILGIIHGKGDKKTWQDLAQYYTIASLFIKNTRGVVMAKEALAEKADAEAAAAPSEDARSRASSARETATGAAEAFRAVLDLPFLEEYNDGSDIVESMWVVIHAYGIEEGVKSAMERWGGRFNEKKLRDGIRKNIPFELREKYPEPELIVPFLSEDTVPKLSPQDAVCLLANFFELG